MKRLLFVLLAGFLAAGLAFAVAETVTVIVKKTSLRRDRQFYAPTVAEVSYRDRLTVLAREKDWVKVGSGGAEGWVHISAVSARDVKAGAGTAAGSGVSEDDVTLAGKGFNSTVEGEYRKKNPEADFAAVDRMEKLTASEQAVGDFMREGNLAPREAGK